MLSRDQDCRDQAELFHKNGMELFRQNDFPNAIDQLNRAIDTINEVDNDKIRDDDYRLLAAFHNDLGSIYSKKGDHRKALEQCHCAVMILVVIEKKFTVTDCSALADYYANRSQAEMYIFNDDLQDIKKQLKDLQQEGQDLKNAIATLGAKSDNVSVQRNSVSLSSAPTLFNQDTAKTEDMAPRRSARLQGRIK